MTRGGLFDGFDGPLVGKLDSCDGSAKGKAQEFPHPSQNPEEKSTEPYGRVHMDLVGPFKPESEWMKPLVSAGHMG